MKRTLAALLFVVGCKNANHAPKPPDLAPHAQKQPAASDDAEAEVALPVEFGNRPAVKDAIGLYSDGKLTRTMPTSELQPSARLDALVPPANARAVFVHASTGNLWLKGGELQTLQLRLNRRGMVKLEGAGTAVGSGEGSGAEGKGKELRDVQWIETRSKASAKISGEP